MPIKTEDEGDVVDDDDSDADLADLGFCVVQCRQRKKPFALVLLTVTCTSLVIWSGQTTDLAPLELIRP